MAQVKHELPKVLGNHAQNFFVASFNKQGWVNNALEQWKARVSQSKKDQGRNILVKSGRLRRAVATSLRLATFEKIKFTVDVPYADIHNRGGQAGRNHASTIPQRKFMGDSVTLVKQLKDKIKSGVDKIWQA